VDLTAYVEKHEFCFDAVLDEYVTNDEVKLLWYFMWLQIALLMLFWIHAYGFILIILLF